MTRNEGVEGVVVEGERVGGGSSVQYASHLKPCKALAGLRGVGGDLQTVSTVHKDGEVAGIPTSN